MPDEPITETDRPVDKSKLAKRVAAKFLSALLILGGVFFGTAGTFRYWQAWVYLGVLIVPMTAVVSYMFRKDPALLERRLRMKEKEKEQKLLIKFSWIFFLAAFILPGLDRRFGWSSVPPAVVLAADLLFIAGYLLIIRVFKENSYASRIIEVEKSQKVIQTGPYRRVRHPMYVGVQIFYLFSPLALGSYWAVLPALAILPILVVRILNEEKVLAAGLEGYRDYMSRVRHRLVPGLW